MDGPLHLRIEILDADADAIEAQLCEQRDAFRVDRARVHFDRVLALRGKVELGAQHARQLRKLGVGEKRRRAPSPVHLTDRAVLTQAIGQQTDLALQVLQILRRSSVVLGDDLVAAAVVADRPAERQVNV